MQVAQGIRTLQHLCCLDFVEKDQFFINRLIRIQVNKSGGNSNLMVFLQQLL